MYGKIINFFVIQLAHRCSDKGGPTVSLHCMVPSVDIPCVAFPNNHNHCIVGPRLSESRLSEPSIIRTVVATVLIEYFVNGCVIFQKCMFY